MARVTFLILALLCARSQAAPVNVLWFYLEDVNGWFSCYGDEVIKTPNIDSLAENGTRFTRFYTPAGVCSTTRSAIATGMMQTSIGAHHHHSHRREKWGKDDRARYVPNPLPAGVKTIPSWFRENGFWTFNDGTKNDYNFEWDPKEMYDVNEGLYWDWGKKDLWGPRMFLSGQCLQGKPADQPFFGQIQFKGGKNGSKSAKVIDPATVAVPPYVPDIPAMRNQIARHYDCLLQMDREIGQALAELDRLGLRETTVIFTFSDHGMNLPRHKEWLYEGAIHMPLIVTGPGIPKGETRDDLVNGIDISAASLSVAGIPVPDKMEGRNFLAENHKPREYTISARDRVVYALDRVRAVITPRFKYLRNFHPDRPYKQPGYNHKVPYFKEAFALAAEGKFSGHEALFFVDQRREEEFYDLENDPHELFNLAGNPAFEEELIRHREILETWMSETGDQGAQPEAEAELMIELEEWGPERCVYPEFQRLIPSLEAK